MELKMSDNLRRMLEENKKLSLDKEESDKPRLIINMGKKSNNGFRIPTDADLGYESVDVENASLEEIKRYVSEHTSGEKYHYDLAEGGAIMVSFPKFVEMINDGYNIYKAEVINENYINIQYQKEIKREGKGR